MHLVKKIIGSIALFFATQLMPYTLKNKTSYHFLIHFLPENGLTKQKETILLKSDPSIFNTSYNHLLKKIIDNVVVNFMPNSELHIDERFLSDYLQLNEKKFNFSITFFEPEKNSHLFWETVNNHVIKNEFLIIDIVNYGGVYSLEMVGSSVILH